MVLFLAQPDISKYLSDSELEKTESEEEKVVVEKPKTNRRRYSTWTVTNKFEADEVRSEGFSGQFNHRRSKLRGVWGLVVA